MGRKWAVTAKEEEEEEEEACEKGEEELYDRKK